MSRPGDDPDVGATPWPVDEVRDAPRPPARVAVREYLTEWGAATVRQLTRELPYAEDTIRDALIGLWSRGEVERVDAQTVGGRVRTVWRMR